MNDKSVWLVTGASRGMGVDIVKAALGAGHAVVATGRNTDAVASAIREADDLLVVKLDVTRPEDAKSAVTTAMNRFGQIVYSSTTRATSMQGSLRNFRPMTFVHKSKPICSARSTSRAPCSP
jgi:NAD(P)-dependent dehydrogenase (short-subunit alcohol dehydrogenase family)